MKKIANIKLLLLLISSSLLLNACRKREAILPDNLANFENTTQGLPASEASATFKVKLTRGADRDIPVLIKLTNIGGLVYGTDYTTTPAANASGEISTIIPSGNNEAAVIVNKIPGVLYDGDEKISFDLYSTGNPIIIGLQKNLTLSFAELISNSNSAVISGGGVYFPNKVFIDFSANREIPVNRTSWDLGFYSGTDDYRVILNSSVSMMVKQINKTNLNDVTASDTLGMSAEVAFSQTNPLPIQLPYIDYPNGDLTRTAIASVASNADDNKVYIVNRGYGIGSPAPARGWKKIRVIRNASGGYTLQHADIAATSFTSVDIPKDETYFFNYVSFENGRVPVEPAKKKWDVAWTYFANVTNFGAGEVPYLFQDVILLNKNVQIAKVLVATKAYTDFAETDIPAVTFSSNQNAIASDWRSGGGPSSQPAVRTDRYYIVKDPDNNYYKLRFTGLSQNGERGYPAYEVVLIKRG